MPYVGCHTSFSVRNTSCSPPTPKRFLSHLTRSLTCRNGASITRRYQQGAIAYSKRRSLHLILVWPVVYPLHFAVVLAFNSAPSYFHGALRTRIIKFYFIQDVYPHENFNTQIDASDKGRHGLRFSYHLWLSRFIACKATHSLAL